MQKQEELEQLANQILDWKKSHGWSHAQMTRQFRGLGSERSLGRIAGGHVPTDLDKWLAQYRAVRAAITVYDSANIARQHILPLGNIIPGQSEVLSAIADYTGNPGMLNRLVLIEGGSGSGKSSTLASIMSQLAGACVYVEADDTWRSAHAACGDILAALGAKRTNPDHIPANKNARVRALIDRLQTRTVLLIDEAQHGAGTFLSLIKTILNRTPTIVVLAAIPTLWRKLTQTYYEESLQLQQNRLYSRVKIPAAVEEDVSAYMRDTIALTADEAKRLAKIASVNGHFSYLYKVRKKLRDAAQEGDDITFDDAMQMVVEQMGK